MLPSIAAAHNVHGPRKKAVARECGIGEYQLWVWFSGRARIPIHKRQSVDRALGAKVDWVQYELELKACLRCPDEAQEAPKASHAPMPPKSAQSPVAPLTAPLSNSSQDEFADLYGI